MAKRGPNDPPRPQPLRPHEIEEIGRSDDIRSLLDRDLTAEEISWVTEQVSGIPTQMTEDLSHQLTKAGLSEYDLRRIDPIKAHFILRGGPAAMLTYSKPSQEKKGTTLPAEEIDFARERTPQGSRLTPVGKVEVSPSENVSSDIPTAPEELSEFRLKPEIESRIREFGRHMEASEERLLKEYREYLRRKPVVQEEPPSLKRLRAEYAASRQDYEDKLIGEAESAFWKSYAAVNVTKVPPKEELNYLDPYRSFLNNIDRQHQEKMAGVERDIEEWQKGNPTIELTPANQIPNQPLLTHQRRMRGKAPFLEQPIIPLPDESVPTNQVPSQPLLTYQPRVRGKDPLPEGPVIPLSDESVPVSEASTEDQTPAEMKQELRDGVAAHEELAKERKKTRIEEREERAQAFAEKHGIANIRQAMLDAERKYATSVAEIYRTGRNKSQEVPSEIEKDYADARLAWRKALQQVGLEADPQDRVAAKYIGIRDTALRAGDVRTQAREEGLNAREKSTYEKVLSWSKTFSKDLFGALQEAGGMYSQVSEKVGAVAFTRNIRVRRIVGSAVIASALVAASGGVVAVPFLMRLARGAVGVVAGSAAGMAAGRAYQGLAGGARQEFSSTFKARNEDRKLVDTADTIEDLEREASVYAAGTKFTARKKGIEVFAAAAVGGLSAYGSSYVINADVAEKLGSSLRDAADEMIRMQGATQPTPPAQEPTPTPRSAVPVEEPRAQQERPAAPRAPEEPAQQPAAPEVTRTEVPDGTPGKIDESGEGSDRAFRELQRDLQRPENAEQLRNASPVLRHFLDSSPNEISREMGESVYGERGMVTHPGDRFYFDENQNLMYQPVNGEPQMYLQNDPSDPRGYRIHTLNAEPLSPIRTVSSPTEVSSRAVDAPSSTIDPNVQPEGTSPSTNVTEGAGDREAPQSTNRPLTVEDALRRGTPEPRSPASTGIPLTIEDTLSGTRTESQVSGGQTASETTPTTQAPGSESGRPLTIEDTLSGTRTESPVSGELPVLETAPLTVEDTQPGRPAPGPDGASPLTIEDSLRGNLEPAASLLQWTPGSELPRGEALFRFQNAGNEFFAHADTPEKSLALAREYGLSNPGAKVWFDNTKYDWLGGKTPRVGILEFDRYGNIKEFIPQALDQAGNPRTTVDSSLLEERIA